MSKNEKEKCVNEKTNDWLYKITLPYLIIVKRAQTKVKYFVLVFLTEFYTHPAIQSPTVNSKFKYNDSTLIGNIIQKLHLDSE